MWRAVTTDLTLASPPSPLPCSILLSHSILYPFPVAEIMAIGTMLIRRVGPEKLDWSWLHWPKGGPVFMLWSFMKLINFTKNFPFGFFSENYFAKKELSNKLCNKFEHKFYTHSKVRHGGNRTSSVKTMPTKAINSSQQKWSKVSVMSGSGWRMRMGIEARGRRWTGWAETAEIKCCHWQFTLIRPSSGVFAVFWGWLVQWLLLIIRWFKVIAKVAAAWAATWIG